MGGGVDWGVGCGVDGGVAEGVNEGVVVGVEVGCGVGVGVGSGVAVAVGVGSSQDMISSWPTWISSGSVIPLTIIRTSTVVPYRLAMEYKLSPR